jgi:phosphate-selective porin OprO/OprP
LDESSWTKQSSKSPRRGALPRAVLATAWLALPGAAAAQQTPPAAPQTPPDATVETPKPENPKAQTPPPAPEAKPAAPPVVSVGPEGFTLASADKQFQLKLRGYVQADGRYFASEKDRPAVNTFLVRRARPILDGTLFGLVDFRIMPDFGSGTTTLQDAYVDLRPRPELRLRVGKYKPPSMGLEQLQSDTNIVFVERNLPSNLVPNRDEGIQLHGEIAGGVLTYAVGAFNGTPDDASVDANLDDNVDLAARVFSHPFRRTEWTPLKGLGLGIAGSSGSQHGTTSATGLAPYRTVGQQVFFSYLSSTTAADTVVADGAHLRLSPQAYYYYGGLGLLAEYVTSTQELRRGTDERARVRNDTWQVQASYVLFGGTPGFEGVRPTRPLKPSEGTWGAVELAARYAELHVDPDAFPRFADPNRSARVAKGWGAAANWYIGGNNRIGLDLERTTFEGGAANGADKPAELVLFGRFQASF